MNHESFSATLRLDTGYICDLGCFKVKFRNSLISGIVGLIDVKWKGSELIGFWADCITLPFDHTPWPWPCFKVRVGNSLISRTEWNSRLTWNKNSWPWYRLVWSWWGGHGGWMYRIMTRMTSDVGVQPTYLVKFVSSANKMAWNSVLKLNLEACL